MFHAFRLPMILAILAGLMLVACGPKAETGKPEGKATAQPAANAADKPAGKAIRIGFLVKQPEESWFQNEWKFAQQCADQHGFELLKIPGQDGDKVLTAIDTLAAQGAQGFVICTPDVRLGPAIVAKAAQNGMKVITVDDQFIGADGKFMDVPYMGISAHDIGLAVGQALFDEMKKRGWNPAETGLCAVTFDDLDTAHERTEGAIEALTKAGFPATQIFRTPEKTTDIPGAMDATNVLLTQHPTLKHWLVCSLNDEGVMGAVRAMEQRGFTPADVIGVGIGGSSALPEFERPDQTGFYATCLISPRRHGFETTEILYKWIKDGAEPPKVIKTSGIIIHRGNYKQVMHEQGLM